MNLCLNVEYNASAILAHKKTFSLTKQETGNFGPKVTLQNKDIFKAIPLEYRIISVPDIGITLKTKPEEIEYDTWYTVQFRINQTEIPKDVDLTFSIGDYEKIWHIETLDAAREYKLTLKADNLREGNNTFSILATYEDDNKRTYQSTFEDTINVRPLNFFQKLKYYIVVFVKAMQRTIA